MTAADEKRDPRYRGQAVNRLIPDIRKPSDTRYPYDGGILQRIYTPAGFSVLLGTGAGFVQIDSIEDRGWIRVPDKVTGRLRVGSW